MKLLFLADGENAELYADDNERELLWSSADDDSFPAEFPDGVTKENAREVLVYLDSEDYLDGEDPGAVTIDEEDGDSDDIEDTGDDDADDDEDEDDGADVEQ